MSTVLYGPFPFDEKVVVASARAALSVVARLIRAGEGEEIAAAAQAGNEPGLYILIDVDGASPTIAGFWVAFGSTFTDKGPAGPPDRQPPMALELLDACTEEVWWKELPVSRIKAGLWRPLIVFEWPPFLSARSSLSPPGVPLPYIEEVFDEDADATWLDEVTADLPLPVTEVEVEVEFDDDEDDFFPSDDWEELPLERSVITVVRGQLEHGRALHKGTFGLIPPGTLGDARRVVPFDEWMSAARDPSAKWIHEDDDADDQSRLGGPLSLPGGRVGFHALGWLTKGLEVWPERASAIRRGSLSDRVVQSRWKGQLATALSSSVVVLSLVISVAMGIRQAATPRPEASPEPPPPAAQPAMAQCSAEHTQFIEEFRCQVKALAEGGSDALGTAVCEDRADVARDPISPTPEEDLQAAYCGLLDRSEQGWTARFGRSEESPKANWGEFAAAQACFNVQGYPFGYELQTFGDRKVADTDRFLKDDSLRVEPLMLLVSNLQEACDAYRDRLEARVEGAIFATHVGDSRGRQYGGRKTLRELATDFALVGVPDEQALCFREGMASGLEFNAYHRICTSGRGPNDSADRQFGTIGQADDESSTTGILIWTKLKGQVGGEASTPVVDRYVQARFGNYQPEVTNGISLDTLGSQVNRAEPVWQCHMMLAGLYADGAPPGDSGLGQWEVRVPMPTSYGVSGAGARSQLQLDSALIPMREGLLPGGICWEVVSRRLTQYAPIHPLLANPDDAGWPSGEQQLCGQVCASYYGVSKSSFEDDWSTPYADLDKCVSLSRPAGSRAERDRLGRNSLDELRVPYHSVAVGTNSYRWIAPDHADVCAFNLVAQNLIPGSEDEGYIVGGRAPEEWAGSTSDGSGIAGNPGRAIDVVQRAYRPGTGGGSGVEACGDVATQCFTSIMLDVINPRADESERKQRYEYLSAWQERIRSTAGLDEGTIRERHPWCAAVYPYLLPPGVTRSGVTELDEPCRRGVELARAKTIAAIEYIATDNTVVERQ